MSKDREPHQEPDSDVDPVNWSRETTDENRIVLTTKTVVSIVIAMITSTVIATVFVVTGYYDMKSTQMALQGEVASLRREIKEQRESYWSVAEQREYMSQIKEKNTDLQPHPLKVPSVYEVRTALGR